LLRRARSPRERLCLGDLVGREPVTAELLGAASQLDLLIAGNHHAWALLGHGGSGVSYSVSIFWASTSASTTERMLGYVFSTRPRLPRR
jgi:hypothetical protein